MPFASLSSPKGEPGEQKVHDPKARCRTKFLTREPNLTHVDFASADNAHEAPAEGRLITNGIGGSARDLLRRERWSNSVAVSTIAFSRWCK